MAVTYRPVTWLIRSSGTVLLTTDGSSTLP